MPDDAYAVTSGAYDLFAASARPAQLAALDAVEGLLRPEAGPILDIGAGSGTLTAALFERLPSARVLAIEPSFAMRALALSRLAAHPAWCERVTVRPEDFFSAALPARIGGALLLGVLGHFDPGERAAVLAELAARLPDGGAALLDLQAPERPRRVEAYEFTVAQIGEITYRGIAEAWPLDGELMRWRMTSLSLEGERVLTEHTYEMLFRHPAPSTVEREAAQVGLTLEPLGDELHWILRRP
ncbi:class I SAM-dependent methyltransferase [Brachybacterium huguangmaarense]|uniref:Class I SAM-dependent methyltransferase n=1 Tax=Brachybacterium huguangmaarense TaxID=1652028 RepID=A0ABY6G083_9MICO|nr:class I SAM-dependent methyltransferase [Brachybacterium huguangmaarense]UYG16593.1 class I SAM-dependent methyltransferase [Brachybacterium huguangmaarense]